AIRHRALRTEHDQRGGFDRAEVIVREQLGERQGESVVTESAVKHVDDLGRRAPAVAQCRDDTFEVAVGPAYRTDEGQEHAQTPTGDRPGWLDRGDALELRGRAKRLVERYPGPERQADHMRLLDVEAGQDLVEPASEVV